MRLHKVYHRFSLLSLSSPPSLPLLHHSPRPLSSSFLSIKPHRSLPIPRHSRTTVKSIKSMTTSRLHHIVPINAVAAEDGGGTGSNGAVSSSSSSPPAATSDEGIIVNFEFCFGGCFLELSFNWHDGEFGMERLFIGPQCKNYRMYDRLVECFIRVIYLPNSAVKSELE